MSEFSAPVISVLRESAVHGISDTIGVGQMTFGRVLQNDKNTGDQKSRPSKATSEFSVLITSNIMKCGVHGMSYTIGVGGIRTGPSAGRT
jgi:hypothetical protein